MHLREGWVPTGKLHRRDRPKPSISLRETGFPLCFWPKWSNIKCPIFIEDTVRPKWTVSHDYTWRFRVILAVLEVRRSPKLAFFGVLDRTEGPKSWHGVFNKDAARVFEVSSISFSEEDRLTHPSETERPENRPKPSNSLDFTRKPCMKQMNRANPGQMRASRTPTHPVPSLLQATSL